MPSRAEKKKLQKLNAERASRGEPPIVRSAPKALRHAMSAAKAPIELQTIRRLPELHPLDKIKGKLSGEDGGGSAWNAGNVLRIMLERLERSGVDSTMALSAIKGGSGSMGLWTADQADCIRAIGRIRDGLPAWEWEILRKVCGEAWPIPDAIHAHAICHEDGTFKMFWNTLNHLSEAISHASVSWGVQRAAADHGRLRA